MIDWLIDWLIYFWLTIIIHISDMKFVLKFIWHVSIITSYNLISSHHWVTYITTSLCFITKFNSCHTFCFKRTWEIYFKGLCFSQNWKCFSCVCSLFIITVFVTTNYIQILSDFLQICKMYVCVAKKEEWGGPKKSKFESLPFKKFQSVFAHFCSKLFSSPPHFLVV